MPADLSRHPNLRNWPLVRPARNLTSRRRYSLRAHSSGDSRIPRLILKVRSVGRSVRSSRCFPDSLLFSIAISHQCLPRRDRVLNSRKPLFRTLTGFNNRHTTGLTAKRGRCRRRINPFPPAHRLSAIYTRMARVVGVNRPRHEPCAYRAGGATYIFFQADGTFRVVRLSVWPSVQNRPHRVGVARASGATAIGPTQHISTLIRAHSSRIRILHGLKGSWL